MAEGNCFEHQPNCGVGLMVSIMSGIILRSFLRASKVEVGYALFVLVGRDYPDAFFGGEFRVAPGIASQVEDRFGF